MSRTVTANLLPYGWVIDGIAVSDRGLSTGLFGLGPNPRKIEP